MNRTSPWVEYPDELFRETSGYRENIPDLKGGETGRYEASFQVGMVNMTQVSAGSEAWKYRASIDKERDRKPVSPHWLGRKLK